MRGARAEHWWSTGRQVSRIGDVSNTHATSNNRDRPHIQRPFGTMPLSPPQVTPSSSKMIDPEFAYMGPLAFDPAKIIGELIIPYFASDGHEAAAAGGGGSSGSRSGQRVWLLEAIVEVWETFSTQ